MSDTETTVTDGEGIVFVNRFTVRTEPEHFERVFAETSEYFTRQPGFVRHTLIRHVDRVDTYVNIAQWHDTASLRRAVAHPDFAPHAQALRAISTSDPNTYQVRQHRTPPTSDRSR